MNPEYPKRHHESPFAADSPPKAETFEAETVEAQPDNSPYVRIDRDLILIPSRRIEVRATRYQGILASGLILFFGLATLLNLNQLLRSPFTTKNDLLFKGVFFSGCMMALVASFIFLRIRAKRQIVRFFDDSGITRGDGRHFGWEEFRGVIVRTTNDRYGGKGLWRLETAFASGEVAWIIPQRIANSAEVLALVDTLPRAVLKAAK